VRRTPEQKLLDPKPGSKIAEARDYGIDLTLLVENLRLTPAERLKSNDAAINDLRKFGAAGRKARNQKT
jgi:hypothetical protein